MTKRVGVITKSVNGNQIWQYIYYVKYNKYNTMMCL